jgi:hypothetical protein
MLFLQIGAAGPFLAGGDRAKLAGGRNPIFRRRFRLRANLMTEELDQDLLALKEWLRKAWCTLSDASLVPFERRELRNYMREAEIALSAGFKRVEQRERVRREAARAVTVRRLLDFRIIRLDA